ncbi:uncharacterized protein OCT59_008814 [Rhizophagus irregularis]|uniref:Phosphatidylglycerol/phosphatidylinositol transfer protein n=2 Tax=Rhizophagus irregularis TaxID=588596 RepID=U9UK61_RHIID|nr:hypothetical protein GLOIN_2v1839470 [Rhizophagus irregularis DAOM 181602=DAOM 197198]EXX50738.1 hypothetical protein RirG_268030 [Rhizophagus irregularis DAOM 197198w]POG74206.1 hypothetical protein GLOIN_2v1839470 [Rhizophagus irregularis DAOM 181602=DAOM 197198]UZO17459.1 hypothetical protein OCT59_008814 [Rhizophagus irregularis]GBC24085.1 hypothetical protein GLOIN_2v1839470 [Rhizophagus irregularis DAOM 181602=DAOM 197198]|eukprot:XP_025181072.1 hypothetical protein GLOIN_2v1839470 [Rhizophagus irregularis DAOM 181602=DAOM 197198]
MMKQTYILVVILFAILSIANAIPLQLYKRATTFVVCPTGSPNIITVSIQPDPPLANQPAIFTISGTLKTGVITTGSKLVIFVLDNNGNTLGEALTDDICSFPGMTCPANYFSLIRKVQILNLPATYSFVVQILDASGKTLGCSLGTVTGAN